MSLRIVDMELSLIFIIAAVILLVLLVAFVVIGLRRRDAKKISLRILLHRRSYRYLRFIFSSDDKSTDLFS